MTADTTAPVRVRRLEAAAFNWLVGMVVLQAACQVALLVPSLGGARIVFRVAAFSVSLAAIALAPAAGRRHPGVPWLAGALALLGLQFFNPATNTTLAGLATVGLSVAIAAPAVWAAGLRVTPRVFERFVVTLWAFQTLSASVGVLQVLYPGRFTPDVADIIQNAESLRIELADGTSIYRPMGLTDSPGGAAPAGLTAYLLGLGLVTNTRSGLLRTAAIAGMAAGLFCMVLCQVRVTIVLAAIMTAAYTAILFAQSRYRDLLWVSALLPVVVVGSVGYALSVGGEASYNRLATLVESDPNSVYYSNRGAFLEYTFDEGMEDYPFGAGLGRHGMVLGYFGNLDNPDSPPLWAEIQWTAWLYDGGAPMMVAYVGAMLAAALATFRVAGSSPDATTAGWAAVVTAYNVGTFALTFSYSPFVGHSGLEFWLLNGAIFAAARVSNEAARRPGFRA